MSCDQYYLTTPQYIGTNTRVTTSFSTEPIPGDADYCMSFQLHHTGLLPPTISIQQRGGGGSEQLIEIFHQVAPQADEWIDIFRTLAAENFQKPFVIDVLAMITNTSDGDVSIDNFQIALGACQEPTDACHFYEGFCGFTQDKDDDIDWHWHDGTGYEDIFAPFESIRHDSYIYVDTKAPHDSVARLLSPHFELQQQRCLSFDVHLHGLSAAPGIIQVWREDIGGIQPQLIKVVDGDQGLEWRHIYVPLMKGGTTRFIYEGILGPKEELYSSMGLDEIRLSDGACPDDLSCSSEHHPCGWYGEPQVNGSLWQKASGKQVSLWTRPIVDHTLQSSWLVMLVETSFNSFGDISVDDFLLNPGDCDRTAHANNYQLPTGDLSCNFDNNTFCAWTAKPVTMDFFWKLGNSASVKHQVPDKDYSETGTGLYAYADIYESISPNSRTQLVATLTSVTDSCLTFHYYLEGDHELVVTRVLNDRGEDLWRRGSPEPNWIFGQVNLDASSETSTIMFEAIHGRAALGAIALDNIAVEDGYCAERENWCDFESSEACGWTLAGVGSEDIIVWERLKDAMEDHTYQTRFGYVLAVNNKNGSTNKTALAKSSSISPYGWSCVRWWYIAKPETTSLLTVSFIPVDDNGTELRENAELLWSSMVTATEWSKGMISMTAFRYHLLFGASFFSTSEAIGIAIDDVYVDNGYCGLPGDCAFTGSSLCGWEVHDESSSYWLIQHGDDHTFGDDYYLRLAGKESSVTSPVISEDVYSNACLTFWYRMEQASTIEWFLQLVGDTEKKPVWVDTDEMGTRGWRFGRTHLHLNESDWGARLVLRGTTEAYWEDSVVGVDDIQLFVGECSTVPLIADPSLPTESTTPETTAMTESTSPPLTQYDCDFEDFKKPYCDWYNAQGETCSWSTTGAPMLTSPPGPSVDHTLGSDGIGHFAFVQSPDEYGTSECVLYENVPAGAVCFSFWYYMYGPSVQNLTATFGTSYDHREPPVFSRSGSQGEFWHPTRFTLHLNESSVMLITQKTNDSYGVVAVDDLRVKLEPCSYNDTNPYELHDFEQNGSGFLVVADSVLNWTLGSTGTKIDHTLGTIDGHFALWYTDNSEHAISGAIVSPIYQSNSEGSHCMHFYYILDTSSSNASLTGSCILSETGSNEETIFSNKISQGPNWIYQEATIHSGCSLQVKLEARDDYSPSTTMAIDDIYFTDGVCRDTYSCDFEHDMCFWENVYPSQMREEQMQWLIASPEDADFIGPSIDTTFKSAEGINNNVEVMMKTKFC
ncbi:MAM and LDL-receptor class A domain-containing protein 1-like [Hyalella azteca]|uniref:MAM and LDL-receptor class A domain-containing protein 1-like n=1 Tax=Hyalella azteca TaxID=294128 RepID=A0A979FPE5_HYAAZ|nr:MAM and LDL-receptor class A domain-containing protein 1-like [Hyalella azteca]